MKKWLVLAVLVALSLPSLALPSDLIKTAPLPSTLALSGTTSASVKAIDGMNPELAKGENQPMVDLGIKSSEKQTVDQDSEAPVGVPQKLLNFSEIIPAIPVSVGNATGNVTVINSTSLLYL